VVSHPDLEAVFAIGVVAAVVQAAGAIFLLFGPDPALLFTAAPFAIMAVINLRFAEMMANSLFSIVVAQSILAAHDSSGPSQTKEFDYVSLLTCPLGNPSRLNRYLKTNHAPRIYLTKHVFESGHDSITACPSGKERLKA
jgi:hypothetical protein